MGRVWVARDTASIPERLVAIKTALKGQERNEDFWTVLLDEARIASRVDHPNVCAIHAADAERGVVYLVMDWSDGGSLRELLNALPGHRLEPLIAARIGVRVCAGLHAAHELLDDDGSPLGVVHRDVSPQNILLSTQGRVRLTDFGIARARGRLHAPTQTGKIKGKINYIAPEQVTNRNIDRRVDIFAMGVVLYEATTGGRPFSGDDALATLYQLLEQPIVPPSEMLAGFPEGLDKIILRAMARVPDERYASAADLGRALEGWIVSQNEVISDTDVGKLVSHVLSDRIASRERAIKDAIAHIEAEETQAMDLPEPAPDTLGGAASTPPLASPGKPTLRRVFMGTAAAAALATAWGAISYRTSSASTAVSAPAPSARALKPVEGEPEPVAKVEITLRAEPAHAKLYLDDGPALPNPHHTIVRRDQVVHRVRASADGYADITQEIRFDHSKEVVVVLKDKPVQRTPPVVSQRTAAKALPSPAAGKGANRLNASNAAVRQRTVRKLDTDNPFAQKP